MTAIDTCVGSLDFAMKQPPVVLMRKVSGPPPEDGSWVRYRLAESQADGAGGLNIPSALYAP